MGYLGLTHRADLRQYRYCCSVYNIYKVKTYTVYKATTAVTLLLYIPYKQDPYMYLLSSKYMIKSNIVEYCWNAMEIMV